MREQLLLTADVLYKELGSPNPSRTLYVEKDGSTRWLTHRYKLGQLPYTATITAWAEDEPEPSCDGKTIKIDGKKYKLKAVD